MLKVTVFYGGLLAIWFLVLSIRVIQGRMGKGRPSLGDGGDPMMQRRIRGHANFAEYVPLTLMLIAFLELNGWPAWVIHLLGANLLLGRILHGYAFAFTREYVMGRSVGIGLTFLVLLIAASLCVFTGVQSL